MPEEKLGTVVLSFGREKGDTIYWTEFAAQGVTLKQAKKLHKKITNPKTKIEVNWKEDI